MTMMTNNILTASIKNLAGARAGAETASEGQSFELGGESAAGSFAALIAGLAEGAGQPGADGKSTGDASKPARKSKSDASTAESAIDASSTPIADPVMIAAQSFAPAPAPVAAPIIAAATAPAAKSDAAPADDVRVASAPAKASATRAVEQAPAPATAMAATLPINPAPAGTEATISAGATPAPHTVTERASLPEAATPAPKAQRDQATPEAAPVIQQASSTPAQTIAKPASTAADPAVTLTARADDAPALPAEASVPASAAVAPASPAVAPQSALANRAASPVSTQARSQQTPVIATTAAEPAQAPAIATTAGWPVPILPTDDAAPAVPEAPATGKSAKLPASKAPTPALTEAFLRAAQTVLGKQTTPAPATSEGTVAAIPSGGDTAPVIASSSGTPAVAPAPDQKGNGTKDDGIALSMPIVLGSGPRSGNTAPESVAKPKSGVTASKADAATVSTDTPIAISASTSGNAQQNSAEREGSREREPRADRQTSEPSLATASQPVREFAQSLPPLVQAQIGLAPDRAAFTLQPASTAQALGAEVIDMGVSGQWIDRVASEISTLAQGTGNSRFTLMPPHLGRIEISLAQAENSTSVHFATETDEATDRIRAAQASLQSDSRLSGLSIGTITVEKSQQSFDQATRDSSQWTQGNRPGADGNAQSQAQTQSGGQGFSSREGKAPGREAVNHLAETSEGVGPRVSADSPGVRFA
jgi:flagellar hook-length control protein FliK